MTDNKGRVELKNLGAWRQVKGLTQEELAERAGINRTTLYRPENRRNFAYALTIKRLARGLGVTTQALVNDEPRA